MMLNKLTGTYDLIVILGGAYLISYTNKESWHLSFDRKWKSDRLIPFRIENYLVNSILCISFILFLLFPILMTNFFVGASSEELFYYGASRSLFLMYCSFAFSASYIYRLSGKVYLLHNIILSLFLWKLPGIIVSNFSLNKYISTWLCLIFPYAFNFSVLQNQRELLDLFFPYFLGVTTFLFLFIGSIYKRPYLKVKAIILFHLILLLCTFYGLNNYSNTIKKDLNSNFKEIKPKSLIHLDIYFSRNNIFNNYGLAIDEFENFFYLKNILEHLKNENLINTYSIIEEKKSSNNSPTNNSAEIFSPKASDLFFYINSSENINTGSLLGFSKSEFQSFVNIYFMSLIKKKKFKIGLNQLNNSWSKKGGGKSILLSRLENIFDIEVIDYLKTNFKQYDLVIVTDNSNLTTKYYDSLFNYFNQGGKVIFISDGHTMDQANQFVFIKNKTKVDYFFNKLNVKRDNNYFITPKLKTSYESAEEFLSEGKSFLVNCNSKSCLSYTKGFFLRSRSNGAFLLPSYFTYDEKKSNFHYNPFISLSSSDFDVRLSKNDFVSPVEIGELEIVDVNDQNLHLSLDVSNSQGGQIRLIGDKDIFSNSGGEQIPFHLMGKQLLLTNILRLFYQPSFKYKYKEPKIIPSRYVGFFSVENSLINERIGIAEEIKNLKIQEIFAKSEISKIRSSDRKNVSDEINLLSRKLNEVTTKMLNRLASIRILTFFISVMFCLGLSSLVKFSLFFYRRRQRKIWAHLD